MPFTYRDNTSEGVDGSHAGEQENRGEGTGRGLPALVHVAPAMHPKASHQTATYTSSIGLSSDRNLFKMLTGVAKYRDEDWRERDATFIFIWPQSPPLSLSLSPSLYVHIDTSCALHSPVTALGTANNARVGGGPRKPEPRRRLASTGSLAGGGRRSRTPGRAP